MSLDHRRGSSTGVGSLVARALGRPKESRRVLRKKSRADLARTIAGSSRAANVSAVADEKHDETVRYRAVAGERDGALDDTDDDFGTPTTTTDGPDGQQRLTPWEAHRLKYKDVHARLNTQTGEYQDYTSMLHCLGLQDNINEWDYRPRRGTGEDDDENRTRPPGEPGVASLSAELWAMIAEDLYMDDPKDAASLALASRTLYERLAPEPFLALNLPQHYKAKIAFLTQFDRDLPHHLLCFPCAQYHRRTQEGHERLQPAHVLNPLFRCPNARNPLRPPSRHRITPGRTLPYTFVQLLTRAHRFSSSLYGISDPDLLARRWKRDGWLHSVRFHIHPPTGHLLMRVISQTFCPVESSSMTMSPAAKRLLLYSREDYTPYFSVCAHWRDGNLMAACKCALDHVPRTPDKGGLQGVEMRVRNALLNGTAGGGRGSSSSTAGTNGLVTLCGVCRPMRRCPECPSEYLIEVKLAEDREDAYTSHGGEDRRGSAGSLTAPSSSLLTTTTTGRSRFRHALVVTRWCDLGDGIAPMLSPEWMAVTGQGEQEGEPAYDSFKQLGKRSISGIFESAFTYDTIPGQRIVSMNPEGSKLGEEGDDWY